MADVTIEASPNVNEARIGLRRYASKDGTAIYAFFVDTASDLKYRKSTDGGATWGAAQTVRTGTLVNFDLWPDWCTPGDSGTKIRILYSDSGTDVVYYRDLDTNGDTLGTERTCFTGSAILGIGNWNTHVLTITKARNGDLYAFGNLRATSGNQFARKSTDGGVNWADAAASPLESTVVDYMLAFPANTDDTQDVAVVFWDLSADELSIKLFDVSASTWNETSISLSFLDQTTVLQVAGAIRQSDKHLILVAWNDLDAATADLQCWDIALGTGAATTVTVTAKTNVVSNVDDCAQCAVQVMADDSIWVAYLGKSDGTETWGTSVNVYYKTSTDGGASWSGETKVNADAAANLQVVALLMCAPRFIPLWVDDGNDAIKTAVVTSKYVMLPAGIASAEAAGSPKLNLTTFPTGIASAESLGSPTISQGAGGLVVQPTGIASEEAAGAPTVNLKIFPAGVASGESPGTPTVNLRLFPDGVPSAEAIGTPAVMLRIFPSGVASAEAMGSPTVIPDQFAQPDGIPSAEVVGTPTLNLRISPTGVASGEAPGAPTLHLRIFPAGIDSEEAVGVPNVGRQIVAPSGIVSGEAAGSPQLHLKVYPAGIGSAEAMGSPLVALGGVQTVVPDGVSSAESAGSLRLNLRLAPTGVTSLESLGSPLLHQRVRPPGILAPGFAYGGFGRNTTGGTSVYHVTTLNDSGTGSLRDAVSVAGRYVVFDVGGEIALASLLDLKGNLTIAGETAPSPITITGKVVRLRSADSAHNVILRHLRIRNSDTDGISLNGVHDVILDHLTISGCTDDSLRFTLNASYDMTIQWCLLYKDPAAAKNVLQQAQSRRITYAFCLFRATSRCPQIEYDVAVDPTELTADVVNCVMVGWGSGEATRIQNRAWVNYRRNFTEAESGGDVPDTLIVTGTGTRAWVWDNTSVDSFAFSQGTEPEPFAYEPMFPDVEPCLGVQLVVKDVGCRPLTAGDQAVVDLVTVSPTCSTVADELLATYLRDGKEQVSPARLNLTVFPSGIASAEAMGSPNVGRQAIAPTGITSAEATGTPRLNLRLSPTGISTAEAMGSPIVERAGMVTLDGIASIEAFGAPKVNRRFLQPGLLPPGFAYGGFGRATTGGAGKPVYRVTTLADSGPGSFRDAVSQPNRYIVFDVGGEITLLTFVTFRPNLTIAGETAPTPITLSGKTLALRGNEGVENVILRYLRVRNSDDKGIQIYNGVQNVVLDHVSVSDSADFNLQISTSCQDITVCWSLFHKAGASNVSVKPTCKRISMHHCLFKATSLNPTGQIDDAGGIATEVTIDLRCCAVISWGSGEGARFSKGAWGNVVRCFFAANGGDVGDELVVDTVTSGRAFAWGNVSKDGTNVDGVSTERVPFSFEPIAPELDACTSAQLVKYDAGCQPLDATDQAIADLLVVTPTCTVIPNGTLDGWKRDRFEQVGRERLNLRLRPAGAASAEAAGAPKVIGGTPTILPVGVPSAEAIGATVLRYGQTLLPAGIATVEAFGDPRVALRGTVLPDGIPSAEAAGSPVLNLTVFPAGVTSPEAIGEPTVIWRQYLTPASIASAEATGDINAAIQQFLLPEGLVPPSPQLGDVAAKFGVQSMRLTSIESDEALGAPFVHRQIRPDGIASEESAGTPRLNLRLLPFGAFGTGFVYSGFGSQTRGGADGTVRRVTNLNDSGAGSLRAALITNSVIVFDVIGQIELASVLTVPSNVTIAGETAPGGCITLNGWGLRIINGTHDVIVRYLRVTNAAIDSFQVYNGCYNVVLDHVTGIDALDGNLDITQDSHDVTVSWSLFWKNPSAPEPAKNSLLKYNLSRVSIHHCLFSSLSRNPTIESDESGTPPAQRQVDFRNNVVMKWGPGVGLDVGKGGWASVVRNLFSALGGDGGDTVVFDEANNARGFFLENVSIDSRPFPASTEPTDDQPALIYPDVDACTAAQLVKRDAGCRPLEAAEQALVDELVVTPTCTVVPDATLDEWLQPHDQMGRSAIAFGGVTVQPVGIATAEVMGATKVVIVLRPDGIPTAEAPGSPTVTATTTQTLRPDAIAGAEGAGAPRLNLRLLPAGIGTAEGLGTPILTAGGPRVQPAGIASGEAVGTPRLNLVIRPAGAASLEVAGIPRLVITVLPSGIATAEIVGTPTLTQTAAIVRPAGVASGEAPGAPQINRQIRPDGVLSGEVPGSPAVIPGGIAIQPTGAASTEAAGAPQINRQVRPAGVGSDEQAGGVTVGLRLQAAGLASLEAVGGPRIVLYVRPPGVPSEEVIGTPALAGYIRPAGIVSAELVGVPVVAIEQFLVPTGVGSAEQAGTVAVLRGVWLIQPPGLGSQEAIGTPALALTRLVLPSGVGSAAQAGSVTAALTIFPAGLASVEAFGDPLLTKRITTQPDGIFSAEVFGAPIVTPRGTLRPDGILSAEVFGAPTVAHAGHRIIPDGIVSGEVLGAPRVAYLVVLQPSGIAGAELIGMPLLGVQVRPAGIATAELVGALTLTGGWRYGWKVRFTNEALAAPTFGTSETWAAARFGNGETWVSTTMTGEVVP